MAALKRSGLSEPPRDDAASTIITLERADSVDARALIAELEGELVPLYPEESRHGYSVDKLLQEAVAFFVTRHDGTPAGCGGVQLYSEYGEIKRMYVRPAFRGLGLGSLMLGRLAEHVRERGVEILRLETGIYQYAAIGLYERFGFRRIAPFGNYRPDPLSAFYERRFT
jgi:putative acetyltransferase